MRWRRNRRHASTLTANDQCDAHERAEDELGTTRTLQNRHEISADRSRCHRPDRGHDPKDRNSNDPTPRFVDHRRESEADPTHDQCDVQRARVSIPEPDGKGSFSVLTIRRNVSQVVDHEQRTCPATHSGPEHPGPPRYSLDDHIDRTHGGDESEEDEDEQLTETGVAVGRWTTGIEPASCDGRGPDEKQPRSRDQSQNCPSSCGNEKTRHGRSSHSLRGRHLPGHESDGPDSPVVCPSDAVAVVIRVIHPDLERHTHRESETRSPEQGPFFARTQSRPDGDGNDGRRQRARSGTNDPTVHLANVAVRLCDAEYAVDVSESGAVSTWGK